MRDLRTPRPAVLVALVALTALLSVVGVGGAAETITATPDSFEFSKPEFQSDEGERPVFSGSNTDFHDVTSEGRGRDGERLFRSATIRSGTSPVEGAQYLVAGRYPFFCSIHSGMEATLVVGSDGTPKTRPQVIAAVLRQTLGRVKQTGRLRVRLRSSTGARDVTVIARGAGVLLARENGLDLGRGAALTVGLRLTRRGRAALANRRSVKVSLKAKVLFGSPASASRTLRGG